MASIHTYPFDPFYSNRLFSFKLNLFKMFDWARLLANRFFLKIKTGAINSIYKDMGKIYLMIEGLKTVVDGFTAEEAKATYKSIDKSLNRFRDYYNILEEVHFFNHNGIKEVADKTLLELYSIEAKARFLSYEETSEVKEDMELRRITSVISLQATETLHAV